MALHLNSCLLWRVKTDSFTREEVDAWLVAKNVDPEVPQGGALTINHSIKN